MRQIKNIIIALLLGHVVLSNPQAMPWPLQGFVKQMASLAGENPANANPVTTQQNLQARVAQIMQKDVASLTPEEQGLRNVMLNLNAVAASQGVDEGTITGLINKTIAHASQHPNAFRVAANNPINNATAQPHWYW